MKGKYWQGFIFVAGLAIGLAVFWFLLRREGVATVSANLESFGLWPLLGFVAISLINFCLYTKRWQMIVNAQLPIDERVGFGRIYLHRLAGYATGYLTPGTQVAGEPVRVALHVADGVPVKVAILNNCYLGMVRQWQELFYKKRYSHTPMHNPDFVKLAEAYGAKGIRITKKEGVVPAIKEALATPNVVLMDFVIEPEENVFPMVPAGEALNRMLGGMA